MKIVLVTGGFDPIHSGHLAMFKEAKKLGDSMIVFNEKSENNYKIVNSQKLKSLLNYEFKYPNLMNY